MVDTIAPRSRAPNALVPDPRGLIDHHTDTRSFAIDNADTGGPDGDPPMGVGRSVHRINHGHQTIDATVQGLSSSRFFGHDREPGPMEHAQGSFVRRQIESILTRTLARRAPFVEIVECSPDRIGGLIERVQ